VIAARFLLVLTRVLTVGARVSTGRILRGMHAFREVKVWRDVHVGAPIEIAGAAGGAMTETPSHAA
jgi:hypothetical protein